MNRPPELFRLAGDKLTRLTAFNQEQYAGLDLGHVPEELWVDAKDGAKVQSWILKPPGLEPGKKAPLVVLIHGGPQGSWADLWGMRWNPSVWAARGWVVLMPNVRGSVGYGAKFTDQISKDWGGLAYDDLLRSVDAVEKLSFVQAGNACAAGASFGGYLTDWLNGHTDRFKCLVTHSGVFDLRSMYGGSEELWFPEFEFGGTYWDNPESYAKWSPSSYVKEFKTPTLVTHGELDFRVPFEHAAEHLEVRRLAGLDRSDLLALSEGVRGVDRHGGQRLGRGHLQLEAGHGQDVQEAGRRRRARVEVGGQGHGHATLDERPRRRELVMHQEPGRGRQERGHDRVVRLGGTGEGIDSGR